MKDKITSFEILVAALENIVAISRINWEEKFIDIENNYLQGVKYLDDKNIFRIDIGTWEKSNSFFFKDASDIYNIILIIQRAEDER